MSDAVTPQHVAQQLEQALQEGPRGFQVVLGSLYADEVELRHEPALPPDGIVDGKRLASSSDRESAGIGSVLKAQRYQGVQVQVEGDLVRIETALVGTLPDQSEVSLPTRMRLRVEGGRVVAITHEMGEDAMRAWAQVAVAGGLTEAQKLLDR